MEKKFFFKTILSIVFTAFFILLGGIFIVIKIFPIQDNTYPLAHIDKIELLKKEKTKPRIILFGGSNVAFGFNSNLLQEKFPDYEIINAGTDYSLGMRAPLNEIREYLSPNDILLAFPEYGHYIDGGYGGGSLWQLLSYRRSISNLDLNMLLKILPSIKNIVNLQINAITSKSLFGKLFTYDRRNFNSKGDYIGHYKFPIFSSIGSQKLIVDQLDDSFYNYLEEYKVSLEKNKINVYYFPPVYQRTSGQLNKNEIEKIYSKSNELFSSNYNKYFLEDNLFYDTVNHLNEKGAILRTSILISDLNEILKY